MPGIWSKIKFRVLTTRGDWNVQGYRVLTEVISPRTTSTLCTVWLISKNLSTLNTATFSFEMFPRSARTLRRTRFLFVSNFVITLPRFLVQNLDLRFCVSPPGSGQINHVAAQTTKESRVILTAKNEEQTHNIHLESVYLGPPIPLNIYSSLIVSQ